MDIAVNWQLDIMKEPFIYLQPHKAVAEVSRIGNV